MKKITLLVIILIIFNFIYSSVSVYATTDPPNSNPGGPSTTDSPDSSTSDGSDSSSDSGSETHMTMDKYKAIDEGKANVNGNEMKVDVSPSDTGAFGSKFAAFISSGAAIFSSMVSSVTRNGGFVYGDSEFSAENKGVFTISSVVFGEYFMLNSKSYEKSTDLTPDIEPKGIIKVLDGIKDLGANFGDFTVKFGIIITLPLVLFSIVRTVMAKRASDVAAWKKILARWVICLALLMFFEYALATIDKVTEVCSDALWNLRVGLEEADYQSFEITVEEAILDSIQKTGGVTSLGYAIEFFVIVVLQILFLGKYIVRAFGMLFLFVMFPIAIVKHSINLMLGNESDTLGEYFKDYILLSFMQPFHAMIYIIFFFSLSEIAIGIPVLGIVLLYALLRSGSIVKAMFGWEFGASIFSLKN